MATNPLECGICNEAFDDRERRPRILPCTHSLCSYCVSQMIKAENKTCPFCREDFIATAAEDLLFNRNVLDIAINLANQNISCKKDDKTEVTYDSWQKDSIAHTKKQIADCCRRNTILQKAIRENETLEDDLLQMNKKTISWMMKHLRYQGRQNKTLITTLRESSFQLQEEYDSLVEEIKELEDANDRLVNATGFACVGFAMEQVNQISTAGEERKKRENDLISTNEKKANAIMKTQYKMEKLAVIIQKAVKNLVSAVHISVSNLLRMSDSLKRTIQLGKLLAFQDQDEVRRYARVRLESGNKICLSYLREEEELPPEVHLIKHDHILELLNSCPYQTFLELGTGEVSIGRIVIKLVPEGYYPKNFLLMCAGTVGPSYVDTKMKRVVHKSKQSEKVIIGNEVADHVAISGVDWNKEARKNIYRGQRTAGLVRAWGNSSDLYCSGFVVYTRDNISNTVYGCFGMVEEGLEVLTNAISQYADVGRIRVVNSGIIFSF